MIVGETYVDAKVLERKGNSHFKMGSCAMNGRRFTMEDAHNCVLSLPNHPASSYFSLFDGHGGSAAAQWMANNLVDFLDSISDISDPSEIATACLRADHDLQQYLPKTDDSGTTAVFVIASPQIEEDSEESGKWEISVGYLGDSRVLLCKKGDDAVEMMTTDHKPSIQKEFNRIRNAGGYVSSDRVDGDLAVSRAFGDFSFKSNQLLGQLEQKVSCLPGISSSKDLREGDLLILICDGVYENMTNDEIGRFVREEMKKEDFDGDLAIVASKLCSQAGIEGTDNCSAVIVELSDGRFYNKEDEFVPVPQERLEEAKDRGKWAFQCWLDIYYHFVVEYAHQDWSKVLALHNLELCDQE